MVRISRYNRLLRFLELLVSMHEQSLPIEEEIYGPLKLFFKKKFLNVQCFLLLDVKIFSCKLFDLQECFLKKLKKDVGSA
jgi:hypothetical protein